MSQKEIYLLFGFLLIFSSCQVHSEVQKNTSEPATASQNNPEVSPQVLLDVYDSLDKLENLEGEAINEALKKVGRYPQYIWKPLGERLERLAQSAVIRAGEKVTEERRQERREAFKRYERLRRSLVKVVRLNPDPQGMVLLIRHLEEDVAEGLEVLKNYSGKDYGFDQKKWNHWFLSERLRQGTVDTRQAVSDFQQASPEEKENILRTWMSVAGELKVQSIAEGEQSSKVSQKRVAVFDLETIRLQALAVFLEALKSPNLSHSNMAILALIQLGELAEPSLIQLVETSENTTQKLRALTILGRSQSLDVANALIGWASQNELRAMALQSLGNLKISKENRSSVGKLIEKFLQMDLNSEDTMRVLVALVNLGQVERFLLMLELCPEPEDEDLLIDSRKVKDFYWLQLRRVANRAFDRYLENRRQYMPNWQKDALKQHFNPHSGFHDYVRQHRLNHNKDNWKKWWREKLIKIS